MCSTAEPVRVRHFKTAEMLHALGLTVSSGGMLWSVENGQHKQYLSWSAEEAIAFTVGRMLDPAVRKEVLVASTTGETTVNSTDQPLYLPQIVAAFRVLHELSVRVTGAGFSVDLEEPGQTIPFDSRSCPSGRATFHAEDGGEDGF